MPARSYRLAVVVASLAVGAARAQTPGDRTGALMVYDAARQLVLLFGGVRPGVAQGSMEYPDDLWAWDGKAWRKIAVAPETPRPPGRDVPQLVYDAARQRVILFGGRRERAGESTGWLSDLWEWDGTRWYEIANPGLPTILHPTTIYDPVRRRVVMYGGGYVSSTGAFAGFSRKLWEWDGARWLLRDSAGPENRYPGASAVAPSGTLVLMTTQPGSGRDTTPPAPSRTWTRTWTRNSAHWSAEETGPAFNNLQATASTPDGTLYFYQSWEQWLREPILQVRRPDGVWSGIQVPVNPGIRYTMAAAWDSGRGRFVLYGGMTRDRTYLNDTWEFDGREWVKR